MSLRLNPSAPLEDELHRVIGKLLGRIVPRVAPRRLSNVAIHSARRDLKRTRALLRLIAPALDEAAWRRGDRHLRAIARALAGRRDASVMRTTLSEVGKRADAATKALLAPLRKALVSQQEATGGIDRQQLSAAVDDVLRWQADLDLRDRDLEAAISDGLAHTLKRTRRALEAALEAPVDEAIHDLRKGIQLHWRQLGFLSEAWPEEIAVRGAHCKDLSRTLGEHNDLAVLGQWIVDAGKDALPLKARKRLVAHLAQRRREIWEIARPSAELLLCEKPAAFAGRIRACWHLQQRHASEDAEAARA